MRLANKRIIISGASTGIGRASVKRFVAEGASVVVADINDRDGSELASRFDGKAHFVHCDVTSEDAIKALIEKTVSFLGGLDVLVSNAGLLTHRLVTETPAEEWDRMMAVNARGCFLMTKHGAPHLKAAGGGSIVNMSSIAGLRGGPGAAAYAAAKAAVIGLTVATALEFARDKIRVNAICPGWIDTPFNQPAIDFMGGPDVQAQFIQSHTPMQRQGTPDEVAALITYLVADESAFVTAQAISINGGAYN